MAETYAETGYAIERLIDYADRNRTLRERISGLESQAKELLAAIYWVLEYSAVFQGVSGQEMANTIHRELEKFNEWGEKYK